MTDKKDDPSKDKPRPGETAAPKKPVVTLDLTAKEVKDAASSAATAATGSWSNLANKSDPASQGTKPATSAGSTGTASANTNSPTNPTAAASVAASAAKAAASSTAAKDATKPSATTGTPAAGAKPAADSTASTATRGTSPPPTSPPPQRAGGGFGRLLSHTLAGIVGGFLALLGADTLTPHLKQMGISPGWISGASDDVEQRIAAMEKRLSARPAAALGDATAKLAAAEQRITALESRVASPTASAATAKLAGDVKALEEKLAKGGPAQADPRVTKLEQTLTALAAAAATDPQAGRIPQLAAISGRLKDLETALDTKLAGLQTTLNQSIESRLGQAAEAAEAARSGTQRIDRDLTGVRTEAAKITQRVEALKSDTDRIGQTLRVVQEETGGLKSALDGLKGDVDARLKSVARPADVTAAVAPVAQKLAALANNLQGVVKSEDDRRQNAQRIVLSLELNNLKRVLDRGQKYAAELAEVKKASAGRVDLAALEAYKDQGVPTLPELIRDFRPIAGRILDASQEPEDGTVLERLVAGARSIVRIRRTDHAPGDKSAEAIVGRMETALKENRLGDVVGEAKALSVGARDIAKPWLDRVEARQSVDRALSTVEQQLKSSLSGAPAAAPKSN